MDAAAACSGFALLEPPRRAAGRLIWRRGAGGCTGQRLYYQIGPMSVGRQRTSAAPKGRRDGQKGAVAQVASPRVSNKVTASIRKPSLGGAKGVQRRDAGGVSGGADKSQRRRQRSSNWVAKISSLARAQHQKAASAQAPLSHYETLAESLGLIADNLERAPLPKEKPAKPRVATPTATTFKARAAILAKERAQFARVLSNPSFRRDPLGTIHSHLAYSLTHENTPLQQ